MASMGASSDDGGGEAEAGGLTLLGVTMNAVSDALGYITGSNQDGGKEVGPDSYTEWDDLSRVSVWQ